MNNNIVAIPVMYYCCGNCSLRDAETNACNAGERSEAKDGAQACNLIHQNYVPNGYQIKWGENYIKK